MRHGVRKDYLKGSRRHHRGHSPYPFDRLLASRVGRLWDDVYSELCEEFDARSWAGHSFRRDLRWHVKTNCWIGAETGNIYTNDGYNWLVEDEYYVHPWTGILSFAPAVNRPRPEPEVTRATLEGTPIWGDRNLPDSYLEKTEGIWYRHAITRRWMEKDIWGREYERRVSTKSQLGKKALRKLRLTNSDSSQYLGRCGKCGFHCTAGKRCVHTLKDEHGIAMLGSGLHPAQPISK
jgi:hypothetical protein